MQNCFCIFAPKKIRIMSVRVRFAPSPTGALHIGGVRTALFNYLFAKKLGGTFILRIEDTDQTRFVEGAEKYIIESLKWCDIAPTEGIGFGDGAYAPYRQSERKEIYKKYTQQLLNSEKAYYAFDTSEELDAMRERLKESSHQAYSLHTRLSMRNSLSMTKVEVAKLLDQNTPYVIRFKVDEGKNVVINDLIRGAVQVKSEEVDDKVLMKSDGMPTYHLAHLVDDYLMRITHVIRGEEWLPSAALHVLLYEALDWKNETPQFAHLPLILRPDGKGKLSKRDGQKFGFPVFALGWKGTTEETSFNGFREYGFEPEAVINFLALLGWNPGTEQEIFSLDELVKHFSIEKVQKAGARFDFDKAKWFNQQYILRMETEKIVERLTPLCLPKGYTNDSVFLTTFAHLMRERVQFFPEFLEKGYYFFEPVKSYDVAQLQKKWKSPIKEQFVEFVKEIESLPFDDAHVLENQVKGILTAREFKIGEIMPLLRLALAGVTAGPPVFETMLLLTKKETMQRLQNASTKFDALIGS